MSCRLIFALALLLLSSVVRAEEFKEITWGEFKEDRSHILASPVFHAYVAGILAAKRVDRGLPLGNTKSGIKMCYAGPVPSVQSVIDSLNKMAAEEKEPDFGEMNFVDSAVFTQSGDMRSMAKMVSLAVDTVMPCDACPAGVDPMNSGECIK